jgi:hypothetical protein
MQREVVEESVANLDELYAVLGEFADGLDELSASLGMRFADVPLQ